MRRAEIPDALLKARRADIDRIPAAVLAKLTRADLANRLLAAGEYRRRADVPHLDGDLFRLRIGQASEVLATSDPKRAAELVKGAGVGAAPARPAPGRLPPTRLRRSAAPVRAAGAVRYAASELAWQRSPAGQAMAKAAEYKRKAYQVSDPELRKGYLDLAAQERQKAGAQ